MTDQLREALEAAAPFLKPMIHRGMDNSKWIAAMKLVAEVLGWPTCETCGGTGEVQKMEPAVNVMGQTNPARRTFVYLCSRCYAVGKLNPEDQ